MSQRERVLRLLRDRGSRGLNTTDLHAPACDGGAPIIRLAARIHDLQEAGFGIRSERKLNGTATYFLIRDVEQASGTTAGEPSGASPTAGVLGDAHAEPQRTALGHAEPAFSPPVPSHAAIAPGASAGTLFDLERVPRSQAA